ncbi:Lsm family RNA-binding protein [archaeon]|nr:Lsm family RNA-binding protein [archaeon]
MLARRYQEKLLELIGKFVEVLTTEGHVATGKVEAIDPTTLNLVLVEAELRGERLDRLVLPGSRILTIRQTGVQFSLAELADRLRRIFGDKFVEYRRDAGVIVVGGRVRVSEVGVIEGSGTPIADRVQRIYEEYKKEVEAKRAKSGS